MPADNHHGSRAPDTKPSTKQVHSLVNGHLCSSNFKKALILFLILFIILTHQLANLSPVVLTRLQCLVGRLHLD